MKKKVSFNTDTTWKDVYVYNERIIDEPTTKHQMWYTDFDYQQFRQDYIILLHTVMNRYKMSMKTAAKFINRTHIIYDKSFFETDNTNIDFSNKETH